MKTAFTINVSSLWSDILKARHGLKDEEICYPVFEADLLPKYVIVSFPPKSPNSHVRETA